MHSQRYTPQYTEDGLRQMSERGFAVGEFSERLGVLPHKPH